MMNFFKTIKIKDYHFWIILFSACLIFLQHAWVPGFFHDGYLYTAFGKNAALHGKWLVPSLSQNYYSSFDQHPPFLFILEGLFFKIFGSDFLQARLFSGLWAVALVYYLYYRAKKLSIKEKRFAFFVLVSFLLSPYIIKKVRFPGLDIPLALFYLASFFNFKDALKSNHLKDWTLAGLFFGLCFLIKGPPAFMLLFGFVILSYLNKNLSNLFLNIKSWYGLLIGIIVIGIWPLLLSFSSQVHIFENYWVNQIFYTLFKARGVEKNEVFLYIIHLFKTVPLFFSFFILEIFCRFKDNTLAKDHFDVALAGFISLLLPFSLMTFKYSHYIIPAYTFLAFGSGLFILRLSQKFQNGLESFFKILIVVLTLVITIFPITTKITRHPELMKIGQNLFDKKLCPQVWILETDAYPFDAFANYAGMSCYPHIYQFSKDNIVSEMMNHTDAVVILRKDTYAQNSTKLAQKDLTLIYDLASKDRHIVALYRSK